MNTAEEMANAATDSAPSASAKDIRDAARILFSRAREIEVEQLAKDISDRKPTPKEIRNKDMLDLRRSGATYTAIAARYGLSANRARDIIVRADREKRNPHDYTPSVRLQNCVANVLGVRGVVGPNEVRLLLSQRTEAELLRIPNFGKKCLKEARAIAKLAS